MTQRALEASRKGGATTRAKFYPYDGTPIYMRVNVDKKAADIVAKIPETERSRFFTEAIQNEMIRRQQKRKVV